MRIGTAHFVSFAAAMRYYETSIPGINDKLEAGEIFIGPPNLKPGEKLSVIPGEGRYQIEEA